MDLLLWKPTSPAIMEKVTAKSVFYSSADILQPAISKEDKFKLCKSVLKGDCISIVQPSIHRHVCGDCCCICIYFMYIYNY